MPDERVAAEAPAVWGPIEERYWPHSVPARTERMVRAVDLDGNPPIESDCAHLIGWKRLHV